VQVTQIGRADVTVHTGSGDVTLQLPSNAAYTPRRQQARGRSTPRNPSRCRARAPAESHRGDGARWGNSVRVRTGSGSSTFGIALSEPDNQRSAHSCWSRNRAPTRSRARVPCSPGNEVKHSMGIRASSGDSRRRAIRGRTASARTGITATTSITMTPLRHSTPRLRPTRRDPAAYRLAAATVWTRECVPSRAPLPQRIISAGQKPAIGAALHDPSSPRNFET
jgi:hypothetical protein